MNAPPIVFDRALLRARLRRAARQNAAPFLLERAVLDLGDRIATVKRDFRAILDLGTANDDGARALSKAYPSAVLVRAAPDAAAAPERSCARIVADEEALPFVEQSFDLAVSLLSLQWVNDLPGALTQIRKALRPDGLFVGCLVGGRSLSELRNALTIAEAEARGGASPRVSPFADLRDLGALMQRAGFALPVTDGETLTVRYPHAFALMRDLRGMGAANALVERSHVPLSRAAWARVAQIYAEKFSDPDGRVRATFELIWLSGWAPHESQQKPLKPGTARMRLADALGVAEGKLDR